jgi:pectate lyase
VPFPKTTSWTTWTTTTATVNLSAGVNTVRLETILSSEFANIDWIEIVGSGMSAASRSDVPVTNYSLTVSTSPTAGGTVSKNPDATTYAAGTVVTLTATPAAGYVFSNWSGSVSGTSATISVTMDANKTVTANFTQSQVSYILTTNASPTVGGTIARSPSASSYSAGTTVTLTATPAEGYVFSNWSGSVSGTSSTISITMDANKTVTANFTQSQTTTYTLTTTVSPSAGGTVTRSPDATSYAAGSTVTLTASPSSGYSFSSWSGAASGTTSSITITMDANKTVTANFSQSGGSSPNFDLVGFATMAGGTTGGAGGTTVTVSTGTQLQAAINGKGTTPLTIYVNGTITPANSTGLSKIDVKDKRDISILGVGTSGEFNGIGLKIVRAGNIIVRNLKIHHVNTGDKDCIGIEGPVDHVWVDHCELYNQFQGVGQDYYDGLLDVKSTSEYLTYSWNYLHDSWKTGLVGSSESDTYDRKLTMHHNFYENCNSRLPLFRGGTGHIFNNYYKDVASTAINSRINACLQIENNYFLNVLNPYVSAYSDVVGYGELIGNVLVNSPFEYSADTHELGPCTLNVPYSYSAVLHNAADVPSVVSSYAGIGKIDVFSGSSVRMSSSTTATVDAKEEKRKASFSVYPNPARQSNSVTFTLPKEGTVELKVMDMAGQVMVRKQYAELAQGSHDFPLDLGNLKGGVYIIQIAYKGTVTQQRLLVER